MSLFRQSRIRKSLELRARVIRTIRRFFETEGYLEVETPIRLPAPAPEAHIDAIASDGAWLHTSPELCMKRLLAAGYPRIYQICRCFRRGERGGRHLPEFTLLEWYTEGHDYRDMMTQTEALIRFVAEELGRGGEIAYQGERISLAGPFPRITVAEAFVRYAPGPVEAALSTGRFDEWMGLEVEPRLPGERPIFLVDYPAASGALARRRPDRPSVVERFELYLGGLEIANGFSELTDPVEQRARFEAELSARATAGKPAYPLPEPFLNALESMPSAAGNALGIDRLVMLFADTRTVDDVTAFVPEEL
ncbi:MAG: EF-P lysine aminoacylase EpmA [Desulfobacterales bacterium]